MQTKNLYALLLIILIGFSSCKTTRMASTDTKEVLNERSVGGEAGKSIGSNMDKQADELSKLLNAKVERIGEGIKVTFETGLLFDTNSSYLRETSKENLINLANVLVKYPDTNILIEGHTDSTGEDKYNKWLSDKRSTSVKTFLDSQNVLTERMQTAGYGEEKPVDENSSAAGRQANRRVEIAIYANAEMIKKAKAGKLN